MISNNLSRLRFKADIYLSRTVPVVYGQGSLPVQVHTTVGQLSGIFPHHGAGEQNIEFESVVGDIFVSLPRLSTK